MVPVQSDRRVFAPVPRQGTDERILGGFAEVANCVCLGHGQLRQRLEVDAVKLADEKVELGFVAARSLVLQRCVCV